jgi:dihydropteroate synthase
VDFDLRRFLGRLKGNYGKGSKVEPSARFYDYRFPAKPPMKLTRPTVIGIVNITEDSFSDGGLYLSPDNAQEHAFQLHTDGANIIELGAASSGPDAKEVAPDEEIRRLEPLVAKLTEQGVSLCVDSFQPTTQRWCINHGVAIINDVEGFAHPEMYADLASATCGLVLMNAVQGRARPSRLFQEPDAVVAGMYRFFDTRLKAMEAAGIDRHRVILDPGMGYFLGSNPEPSIRALREIPELKDRFELPVLVSVSRKSFLGAITGRPASERGSGTLAAEIFATVQGVDYIRTHDGRALNDALTVLHALVEP